MSGSRIAAGIVLFALAVMLLARMAPTDYQRPTPPGRVHFSRIAWRDGNPCAGEGGIVQVTATNSSGPYTIYDVQCGNGLSVTAAH